VTYNMPVSICRFFNLFGPRQRDFGYGAVISIFTKRALSGLPAMIYGDGSQSRDFTYIDDCVEAYLRVMRNGNDPSPVNFGRGEDISIIDLARMIYSLAGSDVEPVHVHPRKGEVQRLIADASRAKAVYGWKTTGTMEEDLRKFVEWYRVYGTM